MGTMSSRRSAAGGFGLAALACAAALALAGQAEAATVAYPNGGSGFDDGPQGWTGSETSCSFPLAPGGFCTATNQHAPAAGNPGGAIVTNAEVVVNPAGLFEAQGTWTSPPFTVPLGTSVTGATFQYDRQFQAGGLLALDPDVAVTIELVDDTAVAVAPLLTDELSTAATFETRGVGAPGSAVTAGHTYRLRMRSTISSSVVGVGVTGTATLAFDNVRLAVADSSPGGSGGAGTPEVSDGVRVIGRSVSDSEVRSMVSRFGIESEVGTGEGGSLIPRDRCTIVGTPGRDRIIGTRANEVICGRGGNDTIQAGGGLDAVDGGDGADRLGGGGAGDLLLGLRGNDRSSGGAGKDAIGGGAGRDVLSGGAGKDRASGRSGNDRIAGNGGGDRLSGGAGKDRLIGGKGHDRLAGGAAADRLVARDRTRDRVFGGRGRDVAGVDSASGSRRSVRRADRVRGVERLR